MFYYVLYNLVVSYHIIVSYITYYHILDLKSQAAWVWLVNNERIIWESVVAWDPPIWWAQKPPLEALGMAKATTVKLQRPYIETQVLWFLHSEYEESILMFQLFEIIKKY